MLKARSRRSSPLAYRYPTCVARQHEVADGHHDAADDHAAPLADDAIGEDAAEERREVGERRVEAVDLVGELLLVEVAEDALQAVPDGLEPQHVVRHAGLREAVRDVEHQQRAHAVVAEPFPHLGEEQDRQADGVPEQLARERGLRAGGPVGRGFGRVQGER